MTRENVPLVCTAFVHKTLFEGHPFDILQSGWVNYRKNLQYTRTMYAFFRFVTFNNLLPFFFIKEFACVCLVYRLIYHVNDFVEVCLLETRAITSICKKAKKKFFSLASFTVWCEMRAHHLCRKRKWKRKNKKQQDVLFLVPRFCFSLVAQ